MKRTPNRDPADYLAHRIRTICESVDACAEAFDGPVGRFSEAATDSEIDLLARYAYRLAVLTQKRVKVSPPRKRTGTPRRKSK